MYRLKKRALYSVSAEGACARHGQHL